MGIGILTEEKQMYTAAQLEAELREELGRKMEVGLVEVACLESREEVEGESGLQAQGLLILRATNHDVGVLTKTFWSDGRQAIDHARQRRRENFVYNVVLSEIVDDISAWFGLCP